MKKDALHTHFFSWLSFKQDWSIIFISRLVFCSSLQSITIFSPCNLIAQKTPKNPRALYDLEVLGSYLLLEVFSLSVEKVDFEKQYVIK